MVSNFSKIIKLYLTITAWICVLSLHTYIKKKISFVGRKNVLQIVVYAFEGEKYIRLSRKRDKKKSTIVNNFRYPADNYELDIQLVIL